MLKHKRFVLTVLAVALSFSLSAQSDDKGKVAYQGNEWRDIDVLDQGRIPPRTNVVPYDDENDVERLDYWQSSSYIQLEEGWRVDFTTNWTDRADELRNPDFHAATWSDATMPDVRWLKDGKPLMRPNFDRNLEVPENGNPTATYYNEFQVQKSWLSGYVYLQLQPLSSCYVWINHKYAGYCEDGRSLAEFDITPLLQEGRNSVTLQMVSLSTANLLDMNRDRRCLGFAIDVALLVKSKVNVVDYTLRTSYSEGRGNFYAEVAVANRQRKGRYYLEVELWNPQGKQFEKFGKWFFFDKRSETLVALDREFSTVQPWTAETPNLYTAVVRLLDEKMNLIEMVGSRFGFRNVEVSEGRLKVNGKAITLRGVVYADYSVDADGVVDYDALEHELKLLKQNNVNAIRTAAYSPADPRFYEMCDRLGFYVVCDANLHPYAAQGRVIATDKAFAEMFEQRVVNMYERLKNHTSIIAWSLGESEDNGTCFASAYRQLKTRESLRPIIFSGAGYGDNTDVIAIQHATVNQVRQYASRMQSRPCLLLSFGSAEGNSLGSLQQLWQLVETNGNVQGGFFEGWNAVATIDQSTGKTVLHQGLKVGDKVVPSFYQLAQMYSPFDIKLRSVAVDAAEFAVDNRSDFLTPADVALEYNIYTSLKSSIISGEVSQLPSAGEMVDFKLMMPKLTLYAGEEMFVRFTLRRRTAMAGEPQGSVLQTVCLNLPMKNLARQPVNYELADPLRLDVKRANDSAHTPLQITARSNFGEVTVDMRSGELKSYKFRGRELLKTPIKLNFWRLPTDNDLSDQTVARQWSILAPDQLRRSVSDITFKQSDSNSATIDMMLRYSTSSGQTLMDVRQTIIILATGDIIISSDLMLTEAVKSLPRVGLQLAVDKNLGKIDWIGLKDESYPDRQGIQNLGLHRAKCDAVYSKYAQPQEAGSHYATRWLSLHDDNVGLFVDMPDTTFSYSLYPYADRDLVKALNYNQVKESNWWTLNVDSHLSGIGSALAGIDIAEQNTLVARKNHFVVHLVAYDLTEYDAFDFCRVEYPKASSNVSEMPIIERDRERFDGPLTIRMEAPDEGAIIHYTLDGSEPSQLSPVYNAPFVIENSTLIKARAFRDGDAPSFVREMRCDYAYIVSAAYDRKPNTPYNHNAQLALIDGEIGDIADLSQGWIGFAGGDCGAVFKLARPLNVERVAVRFAHNPEAWIFAPSALKILFSYDGSTFTDAVDAVVDYNPASQTEITPTVYMLEVKTNRQSVKAVRIEAKGIGTIPDWHRAKGLKPWLMMDEIFVQEKM